MNHSVLLNGAHLSLCVMNSEHLQRRPGTRR